MMVTFMVMAWAGREMTKNAWGAGNAAKGMYMSHA